MDKYQEKAVKVFLIAAAVIVAIGVVMLVVNATAQGRVSGSKGSSGFFASFNGWQVIFLGIVLAVLAIFSIPKTRE